MSGYVVREWGWHAAFWIGSGLGLCLSFMIREMKTTAMIPHALALLVMETFFNRFSLGIIFPVLLGMSIESVPAGMRATSMEHIRRFMHSVFSEPWLRDFLMIGWAQSRILFRGSALAGGCHTCSYVGSRCKNSSEKSREDAAKYYQTWFFYFCP